MKTNPSRPRTARNGETDLPARERQDGAPGERHAVGLRQAKGCFLLIASILVAIGVLILSAVACILIIDTVSIRGEGYTMSQRVKRYKVACQFIWADFKEIVSGKKPNSSPEEEEE